jgi:Flp pilus assembly protein TadB
MTKIGFGNQYDKSKAQIDIHADGRSQTEIDLGNQLDKSQRQVRIHDRAESPPRRSESSGIWMKGSFFLVVLIAAASLFAVLARLLPWYAFPAVVLACILILYLFGLLLVPNAGIHEKGFLKVLSAFLDVLRGLRG